jgi:hypothetical protein
VFSDLADEGSDRVLDAEVALQDPVGGFGVQHDAEAALMVFEFIKAGSDFPALRRARPGPRRVPRCGPGAW